MRTTLLAWITVAVVVVTAGAARADIYKAKTGRVQVDIPKKWQVTAADDLIRASSANSEVAFVLWVVDSPDVKAALTKLEGELYSSIQGLRWADNTKKGCILLAVVDHDKYEANRPAIQSIFATLKPTK
jgi:hypothetical protein